MEQSGAAKDQDEKEEQDQVEESATGKDANKEEDKSVEEDKDKKDDDEGVYTPDEEKITEIVRLTTVFIGGKPTPEITRFTHFFII